MFDACTPHSPRALNLCHLPGNYADFLSPSTARRGSLESGGQAGQAGLPVWVYRGSVWSVLVLLSGDLSVLTACCYSPLISAHSAEALPNTHSPKGYSPSADQHSGG
ncbi:hypothetical protein ElyMa_000633500 [Elysia marginata]|uniref:Uncharacterized protein n=1 Tax=Elysia marginata TaxID=1093978 RepID=A0AAV4GBD3_9GAST|nr:hypothetical protein ElyMa_000633500 [Elysia marginata]